DHYGYVQRIKAATHALGFNKEEVRVVVMQLVHLSQDGKEVKMSKREGTYVTLDELLDEISLDVARFFFLQRSSDTHLNFDLNLAKEQSSNNPVYYVQYAHARMSSILKKKKPYFFGPNLHLLKEKQELALIKQLLRFPEIVDQTSIDFQVQRICQYSLDLADSFHQFYEICKVLTKKKDIQRARMALCSATRNVLRNILSLMGVNAPEKM
ncbi:arginine--tRNA ligase, partial [Patescibacteria group bacterium]|nr:arginine--tRNA ligase [Patescibacteria group bacterium]